MRGVKVTGISVKSDGYRCRAAASDGYDKSMAELVETFFLMYFVGVGGSVCTVPISA